MPISSKYLKVLKGMSNQYCTAKYGKGGRRDKNVQGVSTCKKSRQVFYAYMNKMGIDYTLSDDEFKEFKELSLSGDDLTKVAAELIIDNAKE